MKNLVNNVFLKKQKMRWLHGKLAQSFISFLLFTNILRGVGIYLVFLLRCSIESKHNHLLVNQHMLEFQRMNECIFYGALNQKFITNIQM